MCLVSYSAWIGMAILVPPLKKKKKSTENLADAWVVGCAHSSLPWKVFGLPSPRFGRPQSGKCNTFLFWLPFAAWVRHQGQFVFMTHCFLECASNSRHVSQAPLTDAPRGSARLSCRAAPALCQGIILAHFWRGLCPHNLLSLAWMISISLPEFPLSKGEKTNKWQCKTRLSFYPVYQATRVV